MDDQNQPKWLSFDPTIHAGHLITACSIIICTLGMWYGMVGDINILKLQNVQREKDIATIKADEIANAASVNSKIDGIVAAQREEVGHLRDDMKSWFLSLDQKLDRKADKR
jgi:hypothetical protein